MNQLNRHGPSLAQRLSLDSPAAYQIVIQGRLGTDWSEWFEGMTLVNDSDARGTAVTILTGLVNDQATLHGLLSKIYNLGLPLLAISCLDFDIKHKA
jgi:hypothetical protein